MINIAIVLAVFIVATLLVFGAFVMGGFIAMIAYNYVAVRIGWPTVNHVASTAIVFAAWVLYQWYKAVRK